MNKRSERSERTQRAEYKSSCTVVQNEQFWEIKLLSVNGIVPIGQRLSKKDPLPDYPLLYTDEKEAQRMAGRWEEYIYSQNANRRRKRRR